MRTRTTLAAATVLAVGALFGFGAVRDGALRASVGSTEASRKSLRGSTRFYTLVTFDP
jgi:hypothetical protein